MADHVGAAARPSPVDVPALYDRHWRAMVRLAVLLVDDVASAEDVVQDAFVALHRRGGGLRDPNAALAYLRATVVNLSRSVIRRRQTARRHLTVSEPEATPAADAEVLLRDEHRTALAAVADVATAPARSDRAAVLVRPVRAGDRRGARHLGRRGQVHRQPRHRRAARTPAPRPGRTVMSSDDTDGELERLVAEALAAKARGSVGDERVPPPLSLTGDGRDGGHRRNRARFLAPLSAAAAVLLAVGLLFAFRGPTTVAGHVTGSGNSPSVTHSGGKVPAPVSSSAAIAVHVSLKWSDGAQFGVGIPVIAYFSKKITDGRAFAAATTVTVNGAAVAGRVVFRAVGQQARLPDGSALPAAGLLAGPREDPRRATGRRKVGGQRDWRSTTTSRSTSAPAPPTSPPSAMPHIADAHQRRQPCRDVPGGSSARPTPVPAPAPR